MTLERQKARLRCAIYTRVSSNAGLEQDFNSLDNQREAAEAYVKSQAHEGWILHRNRYGLDKRRCASCVSRRARRSNLRTGVLSRRGFRQRGKEPA